MSEYFIIDAKLPSLNEYQEKCRANRYAGAKMKKDIEDVILWSIRTAANKGTLHKVTAYPVQVAIEWHEKDKRRDIDNIQSAAKFILDAMTKSNLIKDDGRKYISQVTPRVIDDTKTFVKVKILEEKDIMNKVMLIGNLTRDPELTETSSGIQVCKFSLAVSRNYTTGGERQTDFFNCTAWRGLAENIARYSHKGNKLAVSGSIETRTYKNRDGEQVHTVDINVTEVEFLTPKPADGEDRAAAPRAATPRGGRGTMQAALQAFDDDSDIPF